MPAGWTRTVLWIEAGSGDSVNTGWGNFNVNPLILNATKHCLRHDLNDFMQLSLVETVEDHGFINSVKEFWSERFLSSSSIRLFMALKSACGSWHQSQQSYRHE